MVIYKGRDNRRNCLQVNSEGNYWKRENFQQTLIPYSDLKTQQIIIHYD